MPLEASPEKDSANVPAFLIIAITVAIQIAAVELAQKPSHAGYATDRSSQTRAAADPAVFGVFSGSTPCCERIREALGIPPDGDAHLAEWTLTLHQDPKTRAPADYQLRVRYGLTVANRPGLDENARVLERKGTWRIRRGTRDQPSAPVYQLNGAVAFVAITETVLHLLNDKGRLAVGTDGWSYSLNGATGAEPRVDPLLDRSPDEDRTLSPLPEGPSVFAVFGGRSPCLGIAREVKIAVDPTCAKVKWRVVLFHEPATGEPTTYRIESTLHPRPREGRWTVERGSATEPDATVYRLAPANEEAAVLLLRGDENVAFFMDQSRRPLTGHYQLSYTLNRRQDSAARAERMHRPLDRAVYAVSSTRSTAPITRR